MGIMQQSPDWWVAEFFAAHRSDAMTSVSTHLMNVGIAPAFFGVALVVGMLGVALTGMWRLGVGVVLATGLSLVVTTALKEVIGRDRPPWELVLVHPPTPSFPSTHASMTAAIATVVVLEVARSSRRWATVGAAMAVGSIGWCLVYLGSHWMSDVLVGWVLGVLLGAVVVRMLRTQPAPV